MGVERSEGPWPVTALPKGSSSDFPQASDLLPQPSASPVPHLPPLRLPQVRWVRSGREGDTDGLSLAMAKCVWWYRGLVGMGGERFEGPWPVAALPKGSSSGFPRAPDPFVRTSPSPVPHLPPRKLPQVRWVRSGKNGDAGGLSLAMAKCVWWYRGLVGIGGERFEGPWPVTALPKGSSSGFPRAPDPFPRPSPSPVPHLPPLRLPQVRWVQSGREGDADGLSLAIANCL